MTKPTDGVWSVEFKKDRDSEWCEIVGAIINGRDGVIADTLNRDHCITPEEDRANAKLLAASRKMLNALDRCQRMLAELEVIMEAGITHSKVMDCLVYAGRIVLEATDER
jgi:hypothetical protein